MKEYVTYLCYLPSQVPTALPLATDLREHGARWIQSSGRYTNILTNSVVVHRIFRHRIDFIILDQ
jgi:hypothetical protein